MRPSRGSFSLVFLIGIFFLTIFAQIALIHVKYSYESTVSYAQGLQLRYLVNSFSKWLATQPAQNQELNYSTVLYPGGNTINLKGQHSNSTDKCFEYLYVGAATNANKHALARWNFIPTQDQQDLGAQYMFISKSTPTGSEFLTDGSLYTSLGSFTLPDISFLKTRAHTTLSMDQLHDYGFENNFIYFSSSTTLTYDSTAKTTKGNCLLASANSITIKKSFTAPDRLILLAKGSVIIEDYVTLGKVLIMTNNNVKIGKNCKINGVIFSGNTITIGGKGTFTHDASAVASFASAYYIA